MGLKEIQELKAKALLPKEKKVYYLPKKSKKKLEQEKEQKQATTDKKEDEFFDYWMKNAVPKCEECGMEAKWLLEEKYETMWRACQAHIVPKKKSMFPSLKNNLDNHLVLFPSWGGHLCGCHGFYDSNWYNASTMKIWDKVKEVFKEKLYPLIPKSEQKNIPEQLLKEIQ